jgi:hypothetical protein
VISTPIEIQWDKMLMKRYNDIRDYVENFLIYYDLSKYRPKIRPVTGRGREVVQSLKKKRTRVVRDWFFYIIWSIRIRKSIKKLFAEESDGIKGL